jgi:hypothetical protein
MRWSVRAMHDAKELSTSSLQDARCPAAFQPQYRQSLPPVIEELEFQVNESCRFEQSVGLTVTGSWADSRASLQWLRGTYGSEEYVAISEADFSIGSMLHEREAAPRNGVSPDYPDSAAETGRGMMVNRMLNGMWYKG